MSDKPRILFVDDEKRVLNAMRGLFRRHYELFLANSGTEAVAITAANDIDVIVADQRMPGMSGIELLAVVKMQSPRTVRVLLTGYADPGAIEGSINVGEVFRFLSKPCPPNLLRETLTLAVEASRTVPAAPEPAAEPEPPEPVSAMAANEDSAAEPATYAVGDDTEPSMPALPENYKPPKTEEQPSHWDTVSNVVLSGDTIEERVDSSGVLHGPVRDGTGIVVFTIDSEFAATAIRAVSTERPVIVATTLVKVAEAIRDEKAGVLVTDFTTNKAILQKIIAALKQRLPELVTITVNDGRDSTDMVHLINYGQIFRYLLKPLEQEDLRVAINAAVVRHRYLLENPDAAKRHQVIEEPKSSSTLDKFFGGTNSLRRRHSANDGTATDESVVKR